MDDDNNAAIHHALHGRHDSIMRVPTSGQPGKLVGEHEAVAMAIMQHPHFDPEAACPIYYAIHYRNTRVIAKLLEHMTAAQLMTCLSAHDGHNETVLMAAARSKASGFTRVFAQTETTLRRTREQPHQYEAISTEAMDLLDVRQPPVRTIPAWTFRELTAAIGHADISLIMPHIEPQLLSMMTGYSGNTAVHLAAAAGRESLVQTWLDWHVDFAVQNEYGQTPRLVACAGGFVGVVRALDESGVDCGAALDRWNRSCLAYAVYHGHTDLVAFLRLSASYDSLARQQDYTGKTPLQTALDSGIAHVLSALQLEARTVGTGAAALPPEANQRLDARDWSNATWQDLRVDPLAGTLECDIAVQTNISHDEFVRDFLSIRRPVMLRGLARQQAFSPAWRKNNFLRQFGELKLTTGPVPYADTYG